MTKPTITTTIEQLELTLYKALIDYEVEQVGPIVERVKKELLATTATKVDKKR